MKHKLYLSCALLLILTRGFAQWTTQGGTVYLSNSSNNLSVGGSPFIPTTHKLSVFGGTMHSTGLFYADGGIRGPGGVVRISSSTGYLDVGSRNSDWVHFETDRPAFYLNKSVHINGGLSSYGSHNLFLQNNGVTRVTILQSNGNVGIGTTAPTSKLHLSGGSDHAYIKLEKQDDSKEAGLVFTKGSSTLFYLFNDDSNNALKIQAYGIAGEGDATPRMQFPISVKDIYMAESGGNVGIGTSAPAYRLDVAGEVNATGLNVNGQPFVGTQWTTAGSSIFFNTGNVGLGVSNPSYKLDINGQVKTQGILISDDHGYGVPAANDLIVKGKVAIGTPFTSNPNEYSLAVNGKIGAKEVRIEGTSSTWPDYVFDEAYELPTLQEVEQFIKTNKHLKDVPSAQTVKAQGYSVSTLDEVLLKKIEELTLYTIQLENRVDELTDELKKMKGKRGWRKFKD